MPFAHNWPSQSLLSVDVFRAAGTNANSRSNALALCDNAYQRAEHIWKAWGLTYEDVVNLSPKFWKIHNDPIAWHDGSSVTIMVIHLNLAVGTIGAYAADRPELQALCKDMMDCKAIGQFLLTEAGHGLDATNLETTATLQSDGTFILNSPNRAASKYMPPTVPVLGKPCYAVVWSQLIVDGEKRGIRPFVVQLNDGVHMSKGITAKLIPTRHGATPVNHAITHFTQVRLPQWSLLGPVGDKPSTHNDFLIAIWRIAVGTLALASVALPAMQIAAHIAYKYSLRRTVGIPAQPIISFRTQQIPIFTAVAQTYVIEAWTKHAIKHFMDPAADRQARHAITTIYKSVVMENAQTTHFNLSERLGAQGLFDYNQIITQFAEIRGIVIAEGDVLVLAIRLASELLQGKYSVPAPLYPNSLLAQHEKGVFDEARGLAKKYGPRSKQYADYILPRSKDLVEAIGHRMAYESALVEGIPAVLADIYEVFAIQKDIGWYIETGLLTRVRVADMQNSAMTNAVGNMNEWVDGMGVAKWVKAPILTEEGWNNFVDSMYTFREAPEERAVL
ncbi:acyl-CoA oxidase [Guyanagaster necrorhizus]|uniref:Acyl-CoA oxidase n=1 Tax=Guyanagaster necrorhizus TaxID=856835 RepID=A0A9P8ATH6_9AGAR|nr:acyl-CoA oxidase [Guyanagaster necrorhizus MCA 3950]KAG7447424.1 acyl-CoA oxidase [Guyanagaster necrorhizus MCA 3950]